MVIMKVRSHDLMYVLSNPDVSKNHGNIITMCVYVVYSVYDYELQHDRLYG